MMKKFWFLIGVLILGAMLLLPAQEGKIGYLAEIVALREKQLLMVQEKSDVRARTHAAISLSRARIQLAKAQGETDKVNRDLQHLVTLYQELCDQNEGEAEEIQIHSRIKLLQAKVDRERFREESDTLLTVEDAEDLRFAEGLLYYFLLELKKVTENDWQPGVGFQFSHQLPYQTQFMVLRNPLGEFMFPQLQFDTYSDRPFCGPEIRGFDYRDVPTMMNGISVEF